MLPSCCSLLTYFLVDEKIQGVVMPFSNNLHRLSTAKRWKAVHSTSSTQNRVRACPERHHKKNSSSIFNFGNTRSSSWKFLENLLRNFLKNYSNPRFAQHRRKGSANLFACPAFHHLRTILVNFSFIIRVKLFLCLIERKALKCNDR